MALGTEVDLGLRDIVFDVDLATPRKKAHVHPTQFLAHVYCDQMAGWMKTPLGMEVCLGLGDFMLDGDPAPLPKRAQPHNFGPRLLRPNGWMDQDKMYQVAS